MRVMANGCKAKEEHEVLRTKLVFRLKVGDPAVRTEFDEELLETPQILVRELCGNWYGRRVR